MCQNVVRSSINESNKSYYQSKLCLQTVHSCDNIETGHREVGYECIDWIYLAHDKVEWMTFMNAAINLRFPKRPAEFLVASQTDP
jgi:hypothetical protein